MATKIKIAELSINSNEIIKSLQDTKKNIADLAKTQRDLVNAGEDNSKQFIKNEAHLKTLKTEYRNQSKALQVTANASVKLKLAMDKEVKSLDDAKDNNAELRKIRNKLNISTKDGAAAVADINAKIDKNTDFIKENTSALEKQKQNVGNYEGALKKAKLGAIAFGAALKAAGIGLIVAGIAKLTEAFNRNQKVANAVSTVFNAVGIVFDKVVGTIVDTVSAVSEATGGFDALGAVMSGLLTLAVTPLKLAFYGIKIGVQQAQLAWEQSFFGGGDVDKIKALTEGISETKDEIAEIAAKAIVASTSVVNNLGEAFSEVGALGGALSTSISNIDFSNVIKDAKALTVARNSLEALIIKQEGLVQKYEREAEVLRQLRDDESKTLADRIKFSDDLAAKLEEQAKAEKALIGIRLANARNEAALNKGNIELQNEVLRITNEQAALENKIAGQKSEQLAARNGLRNEELANIADFEARKQALEASIEEQRLIDEQAKAEAKVEREYEKQLAELELLELNEQQKTELLALLQEDRDLQLAGIRATANAKEIKEEEKLQSQRVAARMQTLDAIMGIADAESGIGKAALIAKQVLIAKELIAEASKTIGFSAQAVARSTVAVAEGTAQTAKIGFPQNIPMLIGYAIQAGGILSAIMSATRSAKSAKTPKAADGMLVGASHAQGGIHIEAEGGEAIINKRSSALYRPLLSAINESGGGRKFAQGGIVGSTSVSTPNSLINYNALAQAMASLPNPVVSVDEISSVANRVSVIEKQASF